MAYVGLERFTVIERGSMKIVVTKEEFDTLMYVLSEAIELESSKKEIEKLDTLFTKLSFQALVIQDLRKKKRKK